MKSIIKSYLISTVTLYVVDLLFKGMTINGNFNLLLIAGGALTLVTFIVKPLINLLLLPFNLITLGFFRWISSAVVLYLVTLLVPGFKILSFTFTGLTTKLIEIPAFNLTGVLAFIAFSFAISFGFEYFGKDTTIIGYKQGFSRMFLFEVSNWNLKRYNRMVSMSQFATLNTPL